MGIFISPHGKILTSMPSKSSPARPPFHDWNERIFYECYRPNAYARILNEWGEVIRIVNNFEYISFNIGPTLMSWMERYDLETYQRILEADQATAASGSRATATPLPRSTTT
jgi:alpha-amylase/alpha-mannosidase (GH57 family)